MKSLGNLAIALAVAGSLFIALILAEANLAGLDFGATKFVLPMVLGSGLYAGLNRKSGNRRVSVADAGRKAELLAFPPRPDSGWIVVMRDKGVIASGMGLDVSVDDSMVAQLMPKRFTMAALPVGTHRLSLAVPGSPGDFTVVPLDVAIMPDAILIFAIRASMGVMRSTLRLDPVADTRAARTLLARMPLVEAEGGRP
jgi:hypothetical protein